MDPDTSYPYDWYETFHLMRTTNELAGRRTRQGVIPFAGDAVSVSVTHTPGSVLNLPAGLHTGSASSLFPSGTCGPSIEQCSQVPAVHTSIPTTHPSLTLANPYSGITTRSHFALGTMRINPVHQQCQLTECSPEQYEHQLQVELLLEDIIRNTDPYTDPTDACLELHYCD